MPDYVPENLLCLLVGNLFLKSTLVMRRENAEFFSVVLAVMLGISVSSTREIAPLGSLFLGMICDGISQFGVT